MNKKLLAIGISLLCIFGYAQANHTSQAALTLRPHYIQDRFGPFDKVHALCTTEIEVGLADAENLSSAEVIVKFDPDDIQIMQIKGRYQGDYTVGYDQFKLKFSAEDESFRGVIAGVYIQSKEGVDKTSMTLGKDSYYVDAQGEKKFLAGSGELELVTVPECNPDIAAPSIELVTPKDNDGIALDSYFVFNIRDIGKGIDHKTLSIALNDEEYSTGSSAFKRSGSYLVFFPENWLPIDDEITLKVNIADKQVYGGANRATEKFEFTTAKDMQFNSEVNPNMMRLFKQKTQSMQATELECVTLNHVYSKAKTIDQYNLNTIFKKLNCELLEEYIDVDADHQTGTNEKDTMIDVPKAKQQLEQATRKITDSTSFSVFAVLGWVLFAIALVLKLHYFHGYKKFKKIDKKNKKKIFKSPLE